jgi:hypothetical protein
MWITCNGRGCLFPGCSKGLQGNNLAGIALRFGPDLNATHSQNPQRSPATPAVVLNHRILCGEFAAIHERIVRPQQPGSEKKEKQGLLYFPWNSPEVGVTTAR